MRFRFVALPLLASLAATLTPSEAEASPQDLFGFGARGPAMGMLSSSISEGYEAVYGSPALLAETHKQELVVGLSIGRHALQADTPGHPLTLPTDEMKSITIGASIPIPFEGALKDRVTFGLGFLDPEKILVRGQILYPEKLQYPVLEPRTQTLAVILGLGVRIGDRLFVGAGFEALAALIGRILIQVDATGHVGSRTDDQVIAAYAPIASAAFDIADRWRIGATFRGELVGRFALTIRAQDLGIPLPDFNVAGLAQYIPMQGQLEARWTSEPRAARGTGASMRGFTVAAGALYRRWSAWPGPNEPTVLENKDYGTGSPPFVAHDTISPRIGGEWAHPIASGAGIRLRAGYAYEPTPLDPQTGKDNRLDAPRHVLTAGAALIVERGAPFSIDLFMQLHQLAGSTAVKTSDVVAGWPGTPSITTGGNILVVGAQIGVTF